MPGFEGDPDTMRHSTPKWVGPPVKAAEVETDSEVASTLKQRGSEYGEAWLLTGELVAFLERRELLVKLLRSSYFYAWITILCKLMRLLATPNHRDSWLDIAGYAELAIKAIDADVNGEI